MNKKILIIGGGAAGMMAAITAAESGAEVTIYEKRDRVGKKILVTGNGKCNLTNLNLSLENYYTKDYEKLKRAFLQFDAEDTLLFFKRCGMLLKDKGGYIYPACEQASVVLDILRSQLEQHQVKIVTDCGNLNIRKHKNGFIVQKDQKEEYFDRLIMACGSPAGFKRESGQTGYDYATLLGHHIIPVLPSLVQIICRETIFSMVSGVRCDVGLALYEEQKLLARERGELQLTDYGISGIPVFQFSHIVACKLADRKSLQVEIDFMPDYDEEEWKQYIETRMLLKNGDMVENFFLGLLHKKLCTMMMKQCNLKPQDVLDKRIEEKIRRLCYEIKHFKVTPKEVKPYENAQVCSGGVDFMQLSEQMESKLMPGVFFCGEMIDVDGKCGGYNLQWAWTSGYIAGKAASKNEENV